MALDAKTGRIFWTYQYHVSPEARLCCGQVNRGLAIYGNTLFMGTIDAHLVALDAKNGRVVWNIEVADPKLGYSITEAPLVVKDKVILGPAGGEYGISGFIAAYDVATGKRCGSLILYPAQVSPAMIPGPEIPGSTALPEAGLLAHSIRSSIRFIGALAIPDPTGIRTRAPVTTCTVALWLLSTQIRES